MYSQIAGMQARICGLEGNLLIREPSLHRYLEHDWIKPGFICVYNRLAKIRQNLPVLSIHFWWTAVCDTSTTMTGNLVYSVCELLWRRTICNQNCGAMVRGWVNINEAIWWQPWNMEDCSWKCRSKVQWNNELNETK